MSNNSNNQQRQSQHNKHHDNNINSLARTIAREAKHETQQMRQNHQVPLSLGKPSLRRR